MRKISAIAILCLIISVPVWAEQVYTNSSLRKYDTYKSSTKTKNSTSQNKTNPAAATDRSTDKNTAKQGKITIVNQQMSWVDGNSNGADKNYTWQVTLANKFAVSKQVNIEFNLLDKEGAILSVAKGNGTIDVNKTETFSGSGTIKSQLARQAVRSSVKLTAK